MTERAYKNYLLVVLLIVNAFNAVDRLALALLMQSIKVDLELSDTQLGLLTGIAFALFYSVMGIPIARWADRGNRVMIITITTALWSAAVTLCGAAGSFVQLLLIRIGVAVGEAGCIPPAHSLIADYFTRAERPRAVGIYQLGAPFSLVIGYFLAGWLNEFYGWRMTFVLLGLPGLVLAVLVSFTLREPRRSRSAVEPTRIGAASAPSRPQCADLSSPQLPLKTVCATLWANMTFRQLVLSYSVLSFFSSGIAQWKPAFFMRSYGLTSGELGTWFTMIYGVAGLLGVYCGGHLASRYAAHNERLQLKAAAVAYFVFGAIAPWIYLSNNPYQAIVLTGLTVVGTAAVSGPLFATIQTLVPDRMRAISIALLFLFANLIGMGLGPLAVGALSDALWPWAKEESIRYSLLVLSPGYIWGAWHMWRASKTVTRDLEATHADSHSVGQVNVGANDTGELHGMNVKPLPLK